MGIKANGINSVLGNVESAVVIIKDYRLTKQMAGVSDIQAITQTMLETGKNPKLASNSENRDKTFCVQFNPKELQIHTSCADSYFADAQVQNDERMNVADTPARPTVDLSLTLLFDHVNVFDAFMGDKATSLMTANGLMGAGASAAKVFTVQTEVEGFIAAIRNQFTRSITFQWGKFSFTGQLANVNAQYTMFSVSGRPIRANVGLRIRHEMDDTLLQYNFYQYFQQSFSGGEGNLVRPEQYVQSLLHLGL